ncbi:hypothetical protein Avbf_04111 [Armadillidium vulgare]|nr:hypothetical protein Avbf_04111 [Armadillidium vulgare]
MYLYTYMYECSFFLKKECAKIIHPYVVDNCCLFKGTSVRLNSDSPNIPLRRITSTLCEVPVVGACLSQYTAIPVVGAYLSTCLYTCIPIVEALPITPVKKVHLLNPYFDCSNCRGPLFSLSHLLISLL